MGLLVKPAVEFNVTYLASFPPAFLLVTRGLEEKTRPYDPAQADFRTQCGSTLPEMPFVSHSQISSTAQATPTQAPHWFPPPPPTVSLSLLLSVPRLTSPL